MLQALAVNLKPQGVAVVLVTVDDPKDEAKALSFLKDNGITLQSYIVDGSVATSKRHQSALARHAAGVVSVRRAAELVHFWGGEAFEHEIVPVVEAVLAGRSVAPETRYGLAPGKTE